MFFEFMRFELRYWFRGVMVYIFLAILALIFGAAAGSEFVQVGQALGNTHRNAPFVIQLYYSLVGIFTGLMVTAFVDSAASRDFVSKSSEIVFSKPISKASYLFGRFTGATIAALVPSLAVSLGILIAPIFSNIPAERWGSINWSAHLQSVLTFAIPNTLVFAAFVFALSTWTRSTLYSFIGTLLLIVAYAISGSFLADMENQWFGAMLDPLGIGAYGVITRYWTTEQKNTEVVGLLYGVSSWFGRSPDGMSVPFAGLMLMNRALWLSVTAGLFALGFARFSFAERVSKKKPAPASQAFEGQRSLAVGALPQPKPGIGWSQFASLFRNDLRGIVRSTVFLVLVATAILNMLPSVWFNATQGYGQSSFPLTYIQIENIRGSLYLFLVAIITFFGGVLIWRDRDARCHEIVGAMPYPNWSLFLAKFFALEVVLAILLMVGMATAVGAQLSSGYTRLQLGVYFQELMLIDFTKMSFLVVLALLMHTLAPNKYIGYFLFIMFVAINAFIWDYFRIETNLVKFGRMPAYTYSDIFQFKPYVAGLLSFGAYWMAFAGLLLWFCVRITHRGVAIPLATRIRRGVPEGGRASWGMFGLLLACWAGLGGWLAYNTMVLNRLVGSAEQEQVQVDYEKTYKSLAAIPQPRVTDVQYEIDVFPETRNLVMKGKQQIRNKSAGPIDTVYINLAPFHKTEVEIEGGRLEKDDERLLVKVFRLEPPMQPNESRSMTFTVKTDTKGIENNISNLSIVQNGTFFNNSIAPTIGYQADREVGEKQTRERLKLPPNEGFPPLTRERGPESMVHYVSSDSDWVNLETVISTSSDQIAVAPGSLVEQWKKDNRNYYRYRLDHSSLNFSSFISASYEVAREKWNDVDIEVYYHPEHKWNVPRMLSSIRKSLEYCSANFGPYRHKQARIIEFPRTSSFAQAFPGTMPYSESIGFIFNLEDPEDIDMVFYVVAHEMAHQWWAHQVIGSKMQGATLLSETMAQYSALMIMEKEYGREMMQRFLKYEMDSYLRSRGTDTRGERPLLTVNPDQGYIHYRKGSVILYHLKEMIGEDKVNAALREMVDQFGYREPPYPNSYDMVDAFRKQTPPELKGLIEDLFESIVSFSNRTNNATYEKLANGKYRVKLAIECNKIKWDADGGKTQLPIQDWIQVGAFAKPAKGEKYGKLLYRDKVFVDKPKMEVEFEVEDVPDLTGVDPYYLLIDEVLNENMKKAEPQSTAS